MFTCTFIAAVGPGQAQELSVRSQKKKPDKLKEDRKKKAGERKDRM